MDVIVFGAGSLGSLIGGLLAKHHSVTLVGRDPHVSTVRSEGLELTGAIADRAEPDAATTLPASADLAVVTVKAYDTGDAVEALAECDLDVALSLQNGMGNEAALAAELDCEVLAGTCTYGAKLAASGVVECTGEGHIALGPYEGGKSAAADRVGEAFAAAGLDCEVVADMPHRLWEKLAINAGINAPTALARVENGAMTDPPADSVAEGAAREVAAIAREAGVVFDPDEAAAAVAEVAETTAANESSMLQDVRTESRTEIDAINGYVVEVADRPVPINRTLTALIQAWEADRGLRGAADSD